MNVRRRATWALLLVTLLWGGTFIWMQQALNASATLTPSLAENDAAVFFVLMRFLIASAVLPLVLSDARKGLLNASNWKAGSLLGVLIWGGFLLQMIGLTDVTPAVSAFLTSLYVVFTSLIAMLLTRRLLSLPAIIGVVLATIGAGWISGPPQINFGIGEWLTIACAFLFAAHIIATDRLTQGKDAVGMTATMLLTVTVLSGITQLVFGSSDYNLLVNLTLSPSFLIPLLCCALLGSIVALLLLMLHQRNLDPVHAAVLYAAEPVWAMLASLALGLEGGLTIWLIFGASAILIGNLVVQFGENPDEEE